MRHRCVLLPAIVTAVVLVSACATRQPIEGQKHSGLDKKLSTFAYIEEGRIATLIVNTKATRDRDGQLYMPLEIAVANSGLRQLAVTRESFTLVDEDGNRYPMAGPRELLQGTAHWFKEWFTGLSLDKDVLIHQIVERPGSWVLWALKLGRFPKTAQDALRDQNTVAGMLTWLYALGFVIALIAAA